MRPDSLLVKAETPRRLDGAKPRLEMVETDMPHQSWFSSRESLYEGIRTPARTGDQQESCTYVQKTT